VTPGHATFDVDTDAGLINFAWAMTQFQQRFYENVTFRPFIGATSLELSNPVFSAISKMGQQAQTQARVFTNTVPAEGRISDTLVFDFGTIDFTSRSAVYAFAINMEDKTAETFNALMLRASDPDTVTFLAKIASVEARHAAALRDLADIAAGNSDTASRTSFAADSLIPPATGLEPMTSPADYLALMTPYARTSLTLIGG
jgi:hypothetical protein